MAVRFGTDGVRGEAGSELTPELALALGRAAARALTRPGGRFLVGRDPRRSGPLLTAAFAAGVAAEGADVVDLGVLPTPAVAFLASADGVPAAMVSASHNPFADNGIKLFSAGGTKLPADVEAVLEADVDALLAGGGSGARTGAGLGTIEVAGAEAVERYAAHVAGSIGGRSLAGLRVVVDGANGAAHAVGPATLAALGADVVALSVDPDGVNINAGCGSTHLDPLCAAVRAHGADAGIAFDGDADRCLAVAADGSVVDGDQLLAVLALDRRAAGTLAHDTLVVTVMSNLGLHLAMEERGVQVETTPVGDRCVLERLEEGGFVLGGEQSGHLILRDLATTGDGLLAAVQVLDVVRRSGAGLGELAAVVRRLPQVLRNVRVSGEARSALAAADAVWEAVRVEEARLAGRGRVLLRPSGTEPLVRVMVEAPTDEDAEGTARRLAAVVEGALA